jgi:hypothetical protein
MSASQTESKTTYKSVMESAGVADINDVPTDLDEVALK